MLIAVVPVPSLSVVILPKPLICSVTIIRMKPKGKAYESMWTLCFSAKKHQFFKWLNGLLSWRTLQNSSSVREINVIQPFLIGWVSGVWGSSTVWLAAVSISTRARGHARHCSQRFRFHVSFPVELFGRSRFSTVQKTELLMFAKGENMW